MLDVRWLCVLLLGCSSGSRGEPTDDVREMPVDAATHDAAMDASVDASGPPRSWMDVPRGPARTPRELCARNWQVPSRPLANGFGISPSISFLRAEVAEDGTRLLAGSIQEPFDFGTGLQDVPSGQSSTFLLALDSACKVLWVRIFPAPSAAYRRVPVALGFDAQQRPVLVTVSPSDSAMSAEILTLSANGAIVSEAVFALPLAPSVLAQASRHGHVLLSLSHDEPVDVGLGPLSDPSLGRNYNFFFRSDGTPLRQQVVGTPNQAVQLPQRLGPGGEIVAYGRAIASYYGSAFLGPALAKVDGEGKLVWKQELFSADADSSDDAKHDVGEDGAIALWTLHGEGVPPRSTQSLRELAADSTLRWDVPVSVPAGDNLTVQQVRFGKSTVAAYGKFSGAVRVGNVTLGSDWVQRDVVLQVERGGAVRWAITLQEHDSVAAMAVAPSEEVVVAGYTYASDFGDIPTFVRVYAQE